MTQGTAPNPFVEAKLLGIMLSGMFVQTRPDCREEERLHPPSGAYRIDAQGVHNLLTPLSPRSTPSEPERR